MNDGTSKAEGISGGRPPFADRLEVLLMSGGTLFASGSESPTVALSNARTIIGWGVGLMAFFHSGDTRIRVSESADGGLSWSEPHDLVIDAAEQFTAGYGNGRIHLVYVTQGKGLKWLELVPDSLKGSKPEPTVIYMNHEETGDPAFPSLDASKEGSPHVICGFKRPGGWSVLHRNLDSQGPWETVDSGEGMGTSHAGIAVTADGLVHAIYRILVGGRFHLFHRIRNPEGWSDPEQLTFSTAQNGTPSMTADGNAILAVWTRTEGNRYSIIFRRFLGGNWEGEVRLSDTRDMESNFPSLTAKQGFVAVIWEEGPSLVSRSSCDGGSGWTPLMPILPDSGARYAKTGPIGLNPDGLATFAVAWSRTAEAPWAVAGGADIATVVLNPIKARLEAMVIGCPKGDWKSGATRVKPDIGTTPRDVLVSDTPVPQAHIPDAAGDDLRDLWVLTRDVKSRLDSLERRLTDSKAETEGLYRDIKGSVGTLSQRLDALVKRMDPNNQIKPTQSLAQPSIPQEIRQIRQPTPQASQAATSAPRFRDVGAQANNVKGKGDNPGVMGRFFKGKK